MQRSAPSLGPPPPRQRLDLVQPPNITGGVTAPITAPPGPVKCSLALLRPPPPPPPGQSLAPLQPPNTMGGACVCVVCVLPHYSPPTPLQLPPRGKGPPPAPQHPPGNTRGSGSLGHPQAPPATGGPPGLGAMGGVQGQPQDRRGHRGAQGQPPPALGHALGVHPSVPLSPKHVLHSHLDSTSGHRAPPQDRAPPGGCAAAPHLHTASPAHPPCHRKGGGSPPVTPNTPPLSPERRVYPPPPPSPPPPTGTEPGRCSVLYSVCAVGGGHAHIGPWSPHIGLGGGRGAAPCGGEGRRGQPDRGEGIGGKAPHPPRSPPP